MAEYLQNAWAGWTGYTDNGKLPALLMAVLLFLWFGRKKREHTPLLVYTSLVTICCALPVTAALLMMYQTKFYHYEWIWSLAPTTAVTAWGLACGWTEYRAENGGQWKKTVPLTLFLLAVLLFCGSLGSAVWDRDSRREERMAAYSVVEQLSGRYSGGRLCLWAPWEMMEYAREKDADILLPYGRNLRDGFLNAYSYDEYPEDIVMLEQWMEHMSMTGEADMETAPMGKEETGAEAAAGEKAEAADGKKTEAVNGETVQPGKTEEEKPARHVITLEACVEKALEQGVNCILIAGEVSEDAVARMEKALETKAEALEGYYLFVIY